MKKLVVLLALLAFKPATTTEWKAEPYHSKIGFTVTHMMINEVDGHFDKYEINAKSSKTDFTDAEVQFSADIASINTGNEMRDNHLKSDDFFNAAKYPKLTFVSKGIKKIDSKHYLLTGDLTMRDKTKSISLAMQYNGTIKDMQGAQKAGFKIAGTINRKDFGLNWSGTVEAGAVVSDDVQINCNIEMAQATPAAK